MKVILEVMEGPRAGERIVVMAGETVRIGKELSLVDRAFPFDPLMSLAHFEVTCDVAGGEVRDLGTRAGTFVNRVRSRQTSLHTGDIVTAGETIFRVRVLRTGDDEEGFPAEAGAAAGAAVLGAGAVAAAGEAADVAEKESKTPARRLLKILREQPLPVFGLYDAAIDPDVLETLGAAGADGQSLFEGPRAPELATVAPYLVSLPKDSQLLADMLDKGWGNNWGVYLTSAREFKSVRWHLREFLQVQDEDGNELYFRFYDPRVLRAFLPACTPEECRDFFGPVDHYFVEGAEPDKGICFTFSPRGARMDPIPLSDKAPAPAHS